MYKFNSENEYQLWCQNKINTIYYANIAMNNQKITETVQDIARTLHCSEGERMVKPEPMTFVLTWSTGAYDDRQEYTEPFVYDGTLQELIDALDAELKKGKKKSGVIVGNGMVFDASYLFDYYGEATIDLKVYRLSEWIDAYR